MMQPLNEMNTAADNATEVSKKDIDHFLDYCVTNPNTKIIYRTNDMQLHIDSDIAYLNAPKS